MKDTNDSYLQGFYILDYLFRGVRNQSMVSGYPCEAHNLHPLPTHTHPSPYRTPLPHPTPLLQPVPSHPKYFPVIDSHWTFPCQEFSGYTPPKIFPLDVFPQEISLILSHGEVCENDNQRSIWNIFFQVEKMHYTSNNRP